MLIMPIFSLAADWAGLIPCGKGTFNETTKKITDACDFNSLMALANTVIKFILFYMAVPIAAIMFAYAGFLMITAGGEVAGARTKAKSIFTNALFGLVLAAACWLIIRTVLSILGYQGAWIFDKF